MVKYKIEVDRELCIGDAQCREEAPATFERDDEVKVFVKDPEGDPPEDILTAARHCPLAAITLYDADTGEQVWPEA